MKKNIRLFALATCLAVLLWPACSLKDDPTVPTGATNAKPPVFASAYLYPLRHDTAELAVFLDTLGDLNILHHGLVWAEHANPTMQDSVLDLGELFAPNFFAEITRLVLGKTYFMRPFVTVGTEPLYGPERSVQLGADFLTNTNEDIFQGAVVVFNNNTAGTNTYEWELGNGVVSQEPSPVYVFNELGQTTVRLTARNGNQVFTKEVTFTVTENPFDGYWVSLPGGTFSMGCTPEQGTDCRLEENPLHMVTLSPFTIGKTEVTQKQWAAVMGSDPSQFFGCPDCPVESVSWNMIDQQFLPELYRKTGRRYRLPTEAEWEYAARGGDQPAFKYSGSDTMANVGWYYINSLYRTWPVASKAPNAYGLYDMSGNVWEWCYDLFGYYGFAPLVDPVGNPSGTHRVIRGGSWYSSPSSTRITFRNWWLPDGANNDFGLRLVAL